MEDGAGAADRGKPAAWGQRESGGGGSEGGQRGGGRGHWSRRQRGIRKMDMARGARRRRRSAKRGGRRAPTRRRESRRSRGAHHRWLKTVDKDRIGAGAQLEGEKMGRTGDHLIGTGVNRSEWRSSSVPANKNMRSLE